MLDGFVDGTHALLLTTQTPATEKYTPPHTHTHTHTQYFIAREHRTNIKSKPTNKYATPWKC